MKATCSKCRTSILEIGVHDGRTSETMDRVDDQDRAGVFHLDPITDANRLSASRLSVFCASCFRALRDARSAKFESATP